MLWRNEPPGHITNQQESFQSASPKPQRLLCFHHTAQPLAHASGFLGASGRMTTVYPARDGPRLRFVCPLTFISFLPRIGSLSLR